MRLRNKRQSALRRIYVTNRDTSQGKHSLGMASPGNELFLFVREADRSVREGLADCDEKKKAHVLANLTSFPRGWEHFEDRTG